MVPLGWLHSERKAKEDFKKASTEAEARNLELATELENVTKKVDELQDLVQRLEEKLSNSESENQALQTELEEAKAQENAKQQEALQAMRMEVEEAKAVVIREREAAIKAMIETDPFSKKTPVLVEDTEKINSLTSQVEALKASLQSERDAADNLKKAFSEAEARNSELATALETATGKADQPLYGETKTTPVAFSSRFRWNW